MFNFFVGQPGTPGLPGSPSSQRPPIYPTSTYPGSAGNFHNNNTREQRFIINSREFCQQNHVEN